MLPICVKIAPPAGKTVAEIKEMLKGIISRNINNRAMYIHILNGMDFAENINNDEHIIAPGSDVALTVTCVTDRGLYATIEIASYITARRFYAVVRNGVISSY